MAWVTINRINRESATTYTSGGRVSISVPARSYIYMCEHYPNPEYTRYFRKTTTSGGTTSSSNTFYTNMDSDSGISTSYKGFNVLACTEDLGPGPITPGEHFPNADSYVKTLILPRWAAEFVLPSSHIGQWYNNYEDPNINSIMSYSGYIFDGFTKDRSSFVATYDGQWSAELEGKSSLYGTYHTNRNTERETGTYYRGTNTRNTVQITITKAQKLYNSSGASQTNGSDSYSVGNMNTSCLADSQATLQGWSVNSGSSIVNYNNATDAFEAGYNTIYGVYKRAGYYAEDVCYYYRGTNTRYETDKSTYINPITYYGTGRTSGGGQGETTYGTVNTACAIAGWTYLGFSSSSSATSGSSSAESLFNKGYNTIYGTYSQEQTMTYYPQNGEGTGRATTTNNRYGTGQITNNRPKEPSLSYDNHTFQGWSTTSAGSTSTWNSLWDQGYRSVYAIWITDYIYNVYYGQSNSWKKCRVYYGRNGVWEDATAYVGRSGGWTQ